MNLVIAVFWMTLRVIASHEPSSGLKRNRASSGLAAETPKGQEERGLARQSAYHRHNAESCEEEWNGYLHCITDFSHQCLACFPSQSPGLVSNENCDEFEAWHGSYQNCCRGNVCAPSFDSFTSCKKCFGYEEIPTGGQSEPIEVQSASPSSSPVDPPTDFPTQSPTASPPSSPVDVASGSVTTPAPSQSRRRPARDHDDAASAVQARLKDQHSSSLTLSPTGAPSSLPSLQPTSSPSASSSRQPSTPPSFAPSPRPTGAPSASSRPSEIPSRMPSVSPTSNPSISPSVSPSGTSSVMPTVVSSKKPSALPSSTPSARPSSDPSHSPTIAPSRRPTVIPSPSPSQQPSMFPSGSPSKSPTARPSFQPTQLPTSSPSAVPTASPTTLQSLSLGTSIPEPTMCVESWSFFIQCTASNRDACSACDRSSPGLMKSAECNIQRPWFEANTDCCIDNECEEDLRSFASCMECETAPTWSSEIVSTTIVSTANPETTPSDALATSLICVDSWSSFVQCTVTNRDTCTACNRSSPGLVQGTECDFIRPWFEENTDCCIENECEDELRSFADCMECEIPLTVSVESSSPSLTPSTYPSKHPTYTPTLGPTSTQSPTSVESQLSNREDGTVNQICVESWSAFVQCTATNIETCTACNRSSPGLVRGIECHFIRPWFEGNTNCCIENECEDVLRSFADCMECEIPLTASVESSSPSLTPSTYLSKHPTYTPTLGPSSTQSPASVESSLSNTEDGTVNQICVESWSAFVQCTATNIETCAACDRSSPGLTRGIECENLRPWFEANSDCCLENECEEELRLFVECMDCEEMTASLSASETLTVFPTMMPSALPTTMAPSDSPTNVVTDSPTLHPSLSPSLLLAATSSIFPTLWPSDAIPTMVPSGTPSYLPTDAPSLGPSDSPAPSNAPSDSPTDSPSTIPSSTPTM